MKDSRKLPGVHVVAGTPDSSLAARELNFLVRLAQAAASTQRPDELLELIIRETTSAIGVDVCSLYLLTGRQLLLTATNGLNENMVGKVTMRVGEGITGWVADTRRAAVVPDVSKEPHWKWVPGLDEDRFHSMASVPIESGPRLVGVLNVQSTERREFNSGDIDFLRAIAGQVACLRGSISRPLPAPRPARFGSTRAGRHARWTSYPCAPARICSASWRWVWTTSPANPRAASARSSMDRPCSH